MKSVKEKGIVVVVSGFSGSGKGTIMRKLTEKYDNYALSVSMTTREPREGEVDGKDYIFVDRDYFMKEIKNGDLVEYAYYCDNYYGTPKKYIEEKINEGKDVILEIEVDGAAQIREIYEESIFVFVTAPSIKELLARLAARGTETQEQIDMRLERARQEILRIGAYDYLIVNDNLEKAVEDIHSVIRSYHLSCQNRLDLIDSIERELGVIQ